MIHLKRMVSWTLVDHHHHRESGSKQRTNSKKESKKEDRKSDKNQALDVLTLESKSHFVAHFLYNSSRFKCQSVRDAHVSPTTGCWDTKQMKGDSKEDGIKKEQKKNIRIKEKKNREWRIKESQEDEGSKHLQDHQRLQQTNWIKDSVWEMFKSMLSTCDVGSGKIKMRGFLKKS